MKVFEILRNDVKVVSEQEVIDRIKSFDWNYEFAEDFSRLTWGMRELELIENMVYRLWKTTPDRAVQLWNEMTPESPADKTTVPSFILRLQAQDTSVGK